MQKGDENEPVQPPVFSSENASVSRPQFFTNRRYNPEASTGNRTTTPDFFNEAIQDNYAAPAPRKPIFKKIIIIIAVAFVAIGGIIALILLGNNSGKAPEDSKLDADASMILLSNLVFSGTDDSKELVPVTDFRSTKRYNIDDKANQLDKDYFGRLNTLLDNLKDSKYVTEQGFDYTKAKDTITTFLNLSNIEPIKIGELYKSVGRDGVFDTINSRYNDMINGESVLGRTLAEYLKKIDLAELNIYVLSNTNPQNNDDDDKICYDGLGCMTYAEKETLRENNDELIDEYDDEYSYKKSIALSDLKYAIYEKLFNEEQNEE